jgi:hypothetical protein
VGRGAARRGGVVPTRGAHGLRVRQCWYLGRWPKWLRGVEGRTGRGGGNRATWVSSACRRRSAVGQGAGLGAGAAQRARAQLPPFYVGASACCVRAGAGDRGVLGGGALSSVQSVAGPQAPWLGGLMCRVPSGGAAAPCRPEAARQVRGRRPGRHAGAPWRGAAGAGACVTIGSLRPECTGGAQAGGAGGSRPPAPAGAALPPFAQGLACDSTARARKAGPGGGGKQPGRGCGQGLGPGGHPGRMGARPIRAGGRPRGARGPRLARARRARRGRRLARGGPRARRGAAPEFQRTDVLCFRCPFLCAVSAVAGGGAREG